MAFNHTLSAILRGSWLLDRQWALQHLPMVLLMLKGEKVNFTVDHPKTFHNVKSNVPSSGYQQISMPFMIDPATMQQYSAYKYDWTQDRFVPNPSIPAGSVGIIPVSGPITKYNGDCGEPGSIQLANYINELNRRDNVGSIVIAVDTPGGEARAASSFVSAIKSSKKPTLSFVHGMSASLGVWLTSATDEVYFSDKMDQIGSVGSYCTLFDFSGYLEKEGVKMIEIYAPQSTDKNKDYKDALAGDTAAIEADLKKHVDQFISFVKTERGDIAAANVKEWQSGKMFYAEDAIKIGLADGVKSFDQVVSKASWLAKRKQAA